MKKDLNFAETLREIRTKKGLGIKTLAKALDVNYTYISKIENSKQVPSEAFIEKIAKVFNCDEEELRVLAGKIPEDIAEILKNNPKEAINYLRKEFGDRRGKS